MTFVENVRRAMADFEAEHERITAARESVKEQERAYEITGRAAESMLADLDKRSSDSLSGAQRAIHGALDAYLKKLGERYTITADRLDAADLAMLQNPLVKLGARDLDALVAKHEGNEPMLDAIYSAADRLGVYLTAPHYSENARESEAVAFAGGAYDSCREVAEGRPGLRFAVYATGAVPAALVGE